MVPRRSIERGRFGAPFLLQLNGRRCTNVSDYGFLAESAEGCCQPRGRAAWWASYAVSSFKLETRKGRFRGAAELQMNGSRCRNTYGLAGAFGSGQPLRASAHFVLCALCGNQKAILTANNRKKQTQPLSVFARNPGQPRPSSRSAMARTSAPMSSRSSASASVASTKPVLFPQSKRRPSNVTAWNGWSPIIRAIASVS